MDAFRRLVPWESSKKGDGGGKSSSSQQRRIKDLECALESASTLNRQLKTQLEVRDVSVGEYLYMHRTSAMALLDNEWDLRYFVLNGQVLKQYKSAKDLVYNPQEEISIMGCVVEWEGQVGQHWAFSIVDPSGAIVLRLSALSQAASLKWVASMESAGCKRRTVEIARSKSHTTQMGPLAGLKRMMHKRTGSGNLSSGGVDELPYAAQRANSMAGDVPRLSSAPEAIESLPLAESSHVGRITPTRRPSAPSTLDTSAGALPPTAKAGTTPRDRKRASISGAPPAGVSGSGGDDVRAGASGVGAAAPQAPARESMLASTPVHTQVRFSYLSSERMYHERHSGLYNLGAVILVASNIRLVLENFLKYGLLSPQYGPKKLSDLTFGSTNIPLAMCYPAMALFVLLSLVTELAAHRLLLWEGKIFAGLSKKRDDRGRVTVPPELAARSKIHEWLVFVCSLINTTAAIGIPWAVISETNAEPVSGGVLIMLACILWMK
ncbi:hypothetical protein FOA52_003343, partial [Chlamydomonas sp. UWO 241]